MYNEIIEKIKNNNICILGFGKEGISTYNFIRRHLKEKHITIIDKNDVSDKVSDDNVDIIYGENYLDNLDKYDLIIKTPGISFKNIDISNIEDKVTSQLELTLEVFKENTIGVTGTKGKSTTVSLLYNVIKDQKSDVYLLGNIGNPIFDDVEKFKSDTYLVIEMAAHQLEFVNTSPHIGIILNLFEEHLDHAGTLKHYYQNKMNIFKYQNSSDIGIYNIDNKDLVNEINKNNYLSKLYKVTLTNKGDIDTVYLDSDNVVFNKEILYNKKSERHLLGDHNLFNIMNILLVAKLLNLDMEKVAYTINNFKPLAHRLELVGTYNDITYYNDSIATIPEATINAIKTLGSVDTLIFGGMDRGINYSDFITFLSNSDINNLICMPTTGYKIGKKIEKINSSKNIYYIETLNEAVSKAKSVTKKGKICLMSPAASSYEYFKNFEEKGNLYKELVRKND